MDSHQAAPPRRLHLQPLTGVRQAIAAAFLQQRHARRLACHLGKTHIA